jgi:uncharacterized protein involved in response to NO
VLRVVAAGGGRAMPLLAAPAALWIAPFALFVIHYGPMLLRPRLGR